MKTAKVKEQFVALYESQADAVFRFCWFKTSDRELALDLTQDTFSRFWAKLVAGETVDNPRAFIFTIARHAVIDWYRSKKSLPFNRLSLAEEEMEFDPPAEGTKQLELELGAEARLLMLKINQLEPGYKQVVYLRFIEDLKPQEIAQIIGASVNVVSVRITRGLAKLRELIGINLN